MNRIGRISLMMAALAAMPWFASAQHVVHFPMPASAVVAQSEAPQADEPHEQQQPDVPVSRPPSQFRQIYICDKKNPASASALGEIAGFQKVTVVGPGGKSEAMVKELLPEESFGAGLFTATRLELAAGANCSTASIAILAPPESVEVVRFKEAGNRAAIARIGDHLEGRSRKDMPLPDVDLHAAVYLTNYQIASAKVFPLPPNYVAVLADVTYDAMVYNGALNKYEKGSAQNEAEPMLFLVGKEVTEVNMDARKNSSICDSLVSAFRLANRLHIHVAANGCNNGINGQMVFDLSGPIPKAVFSDWDLSD